MADWRFYYAIPGLEVSRKGGVRRTYKDKRTWNGKSLYPRMMKRMVGKDGNLVIQIREPESGYYRIDWLVAKCFLPRPNSGETMIIHKNRDKTSCWADNLVWATPYEHGEFYKDDPTVNTPDGFRLVDDDLYVSKEGKVKEDGNLQTVLDYLYDLDMGRHQATDPHVALWNGKFYERKCIEGLVAAAYLPQPSGMSNPRLLHKDGNYKNCSLDNLEWVDENGDDYQKYICQIRKDVEKRTDEINNDGKFEL